MSVSSPLSLIISSRTGVVLEFPPVAVVTDVNGSEMLVTVVPVSETVVVKVEILLSVVELFGMLAAGFDDRGILVAVLAD